MAKRKTSRATQTSKGIHCQKPVVKLGWSAARIVQSLCAPGLKKNKQYGQKQEPKKGNEHKAAARREKKRAIRIAKKEGSNE